MQSSPVLKSGIRIIIGCIAAGCLYGQAPVPQTQSTETKGVPARATPADYQAQAKAGAVTIAAEFMGHAVPTPDGVYNSEEYVVVELALFGAPDARLKLSAEDFSLRLNGKKAPSPSVNAMSVLRSLKDPNWIPPAPPEKSKSSFSTGGAGSSDPPPVAPKMPMELQHKMSQNVLKAVLWEGDRPLPQAGLLFFPYRGKTENIHSLELIYNGPAGPASVSLQP